MNLIEKLGGYDRAKDALELPLDYGFSDDDIKAALLEYRRQHNIFEVGDKIIFYIVGNSVMEYADCLNMFLSQSLIRHATDAEIKAGKRRPELDSDTCSDIRNHISSLTKVIDR